jgi:hypothetical protein
VSDFLEDLKAIRERELAPLRREAEIPEDESLWDGDTIDSEKIMRYVEILESTVVGKASVLSLVGSACFPHMRSDTREELGG